MTSITGIATSFIDFTRASNATVTDSDGFVKWAPHNLLLASESFDAASWTKSSVTPTANSIAAPNGTTTADTLAASGANGTTLQTFTAEAISYTFGVWLKRKTGTGNIQIAADSGTYTTVTITSDWALYTVTQTPAAGSKSAGIRIVTSADEVYAWGASLYRSDLGGMQPNTSAYPMYNPTTPKNLLGYTESLTTGWTNSNTTDAIVSEVNPVGLTGAVDVAATAGNGTLLGSLSLLASPYTFSIWLKRKTGSGTVEITVDGTTYVAAAVTGTWTRFSTTLTPTAGTKTPGIRLVTSGDAVYAWGAQLSDSASLDSYVPVYGAAVTSAAYYGPRRDFDPVTLACKGLLVEEQRTNLLLYSAQFDNVYWTPFDVVVSGAAIASPAGSTTTNKIVPNSTSAVHAIRSAPISSGGSRVISVYVYPDGFTKFAIQENYGQASFAAFDCTGAGSLLASAGGGSGATIVKLASGWYRVTMPATQATNYTAAFFVLPDSYTSGSITGSWSGDGVKGIYLWGAQTEDGAFATSYIPVGATTAGATRLADVASVSTQAFPYSATEGTIIVSGAGMRAGSSSAIFVSFDDGNGGYDNARLINFNSSGDIVAYESSSSSAVVNNVTIYNGPPDTDFTGKVAYAYRVNDFDASYNGNAATSLSTSGSPAANITRMGIATDYPAVSSGLTGGRVHIRQITYVPRKMTDAEIVARTA